MKNKPVAIVSLWKGFHIALLDLLTSAVKSVQSLALSERLISLVTEKQ